MECFSSFITEHFPNVKDIAVDFICERRPWKNVFECLSLIQPASFQQIPPHIKGRLEFHVEFETEQFDEVSFC